MIRAVIFDCDGVLVDSEPLRFKTYQQVLYNAYGKKLSDRYFIEMLGRDNRENMKAFLKAIKEKGNIDQLIAQRKQLLIEAFSNPDNIVPLKGLYELLEKLKEKDLPLAVASSSYKDYLNRIIDNLKVRPFFKTIISGDMVKNGKPHPDIFLLAAKKMNVDPQSCLVIEDSINGVLAAKRASMKCIGITTSFPAATLKKAGADVVIRSLKEVTTLINASFRKIP